MEPDIPGAVDTGYWQIHLEDGALADIRHDPKGSVAYGPSLVSSPVRLGGAGESIQSLEPSPDGRSVRLVLLQDAPGEVTLEWPVDFGPDGYYDRLTGATSGADVTDNPALLRFISGSRGHTVMIESLKRLPEGTAIPLNHAVGGESVLLETANRALFRLRHGAHGGVSFTFTEGRLVMQVRSPQGALSLEEYEASGGIHLEPEGWLPRFSFGDDTAITSAGGGGTTLNTLFSEFAQQAGYWYLHGHGISAWAAFGPIGHAHADNPYRTDSRDAIAGQVVGDDGHGNDGYAHTWGQELGWPFPGGYDTRHFGINAMHIVGAHTYLMWTGEYPDITGRDFSIQVTHEGSQVLEQDQRGAAVPLGQDSVYTQAFDAASAFDAIGLYLDVPESDPRFDTGSLTGFTETPPRRVPNAVPQLVRDVPGALVAQRIRPEVPFNATAVYTCRWDTPGSGGRLRAFAWKSSLEASLDGPVLGESIVESVPDNGYVLVDLDQTYPPETELLLVVDQPAPATPGEKEMTGVWLTESEHTPGVPAVYIGDQQQEGHVIRTAHGLRVPRHLDLALRREDGTDMAAGSLDVAPGAGYQFWEFAAAQAPGRYVIEARPVSAGIRWECSTVRSGLGGRATVNGHTFDWIERARREMNYQMTVLNAEKDGLLLLDGSAGGTDHLGLNGKSVGNNYYDILPFGYYDGYSNAWYYASLGAMADLEEAHGDLAAAERMRALMPRAKERYSDVFWTDRADKDGAARFIGCVDAEGNRHDYGFTFVNTLAVAVGLASPKQAGAVLDWMDNGNAIGPDGVPQKGIYHFQFAPRCTTIDNQDWWSVHQDPASYPWGDQIQNGGANLYESYFDLMARLRTRGADDAYARLLEILRRYAESDRLTGGSPLVTGESVQGYGRAGAAGVMSSEFPETSMLGAIMLYGFLGAEARADGLHLRPQIPSAQPFIRAEHVLYHGARFTFEASHDQVRVQCLQNPGRFGFEISGTRHSGEFEWEDDVPENGRILLQPFPLGATAGKE